MQNRILVFANEWTSGNERLRETLDLVQEEWAGLWFGAEQPLPVVYGQTEEATAGDLIVELQKNYNDSDILRTKESYSLEVGSHAVIRAASERGVLYALRALFAMLRPDGSLPYCRLHDEPLVPERGVHIDIGRKYYTPEWIKARIKEMSRLRLNKLQLHFSENEGFGLMSERHLEVMSEPYLTVAELKDILETAQRYHVDVIPSLDSPGHLGQALRSHPEWLLKDQAGKPAKGALDITHPEARRFVLELIDEFADLFAGSTHFHIGGDEFIDFGQFAAYPQLARYAQEGLGIFGGSGVDAYIHYLNGIAEHLERKGFTVRAWSDGFYRADQTQLVPLKPSMDITYWTQWHPAMAPVSTFIEMGHKVINYNDAYLYYVLGEHAGYTYPTGERIRSGGWHPGLFPSRSQSGPKEYRTPYPSAIRGCSFSIWSDVAEAQTEEEVADGIREPLQAMAERAWTGGFFQPN
ncbi:glycoside hydrolase family 20 protein [Paenibacillus sp. NFR01]|uniref:beta-N-acetylhexosaminidase n=1 Tax=Paenibacillus sp. NFR01 TaxID=1566279 RepID=UPI0008BC2028|nr:glycoside hydrolase family 20 protein [Paenibacillus sp. NFR01]SET91524.1 hexosaminidase [Paenibacillus sp. NFR01]